MLGALGSRICAQRHYAQKFGGADESNEPIPLDAGTLLAALN